MIIETNHFNYKRKHAGLTKTKNEHLVLVEYNISLLPCTKTKNMNIFKAHNINKLHFIPFVSVLLNEVSSC